MAQVGWDSSWRTEPSSPCLACKMSRPHCNSFLVPATDDQIQSNQSLPSLSCRLLHSPALSCFFIMSITTSHAIITCLLSLLQLESKFHKGTALCAVVCYCHERMAWLYISQSLQGLPSPFFFHFTPICTNTQLSPKHNMSFGGPCFAITNFSHHPIKPPKYR